MTFTDQSDAKSFFIRKILEQAESEGVILSKAQQSMLAWSESDPCFKQDPKLNRQFEKEISQDEYEKKVQGLLKRGYKRNIQLDSAEKIIITRLTRFLVRETITY